LINATSQTIGLLLLTAMDAKTRDVEAVLSDFRRCLNSYETLAQSFLSSSALDVEQVFKVGRDYDDQQRLHAHAVSQQQHTLYQRQYDYDKSGNLTRLLDTRKGEHHYHYAPPRPPDPRRPLAGCARTLRPRPGPEGDFQISSRNKKQTYY
jgi:hypothetical protein